MADGHLEGPQPQHMPRTTSWLSFLFFCHLTPYTSAGACKFAKQLHKFSCFYSAKYSTLPLDFAYLSFTVIIPRNSTALVINFYNDFACYTLHITVLLKFILIPPTRGHEFNFQTVVEYF